MPDPNRQEARHRHQRRAAGFQGSAVEALNGLGIDEAEGLER
jgi:hypothetical protein